ncbi:MAG: Ku protein [Candidatus Zixiibacteriota bacterium]|jgi:DNA end-binding protein Ku
MPQRAIFKAVLHFGNNEVPVKLYSAMTEERVHFRLLHRKDKAPLSVQWYCSKENKPVSSKDTVKGFEVAKGQYVVLDPSEIKKAQPKTDRTMEVHHFCSADEIDPRLYNRPYYLGPDSDDSMYAMLQHALKESGKIGLCTWTMRGHSYYGALKPFGDILLLETLRYAHEIIPVKSLDLKKRKVSTAELDSAIALIEQLKDKFDPSGYQNEHQQKLMYFIEQKAKGKKPKMERPKRRKPTRPGDLQKTLERSLQQAHR